ncbi:MAG: hypothetical protein II265_07655 [Clostridia bacterium]|nr:hypothetical protein [Clostridia bacterium]
MIRPININLNAAHPELPLVEATTFTGAPSSVFIRGVPKAVGNWSITAVNVAVTYPDNSTTTRAAVESAEGVWVATIPGTATSGRTAAGFKIMADGTDENGAAVTGYVLGFSDFSVLSFTPVPAPGGTFYLLRYFDQAPATPKEGDVAKIDGVLKFYNGSAWEPFAAPVTLDDTVTPSSENGVKSSGIWAAIWGALSALPTGFSSLYDWCVAQLAGKASTADATLTPRFTEWVISPVLGGYYLQYDEVNDGWQLWYRNYDVDVQISYVNKGNASSTSVSWSADEVSTPFGFSATRTALSGYQLGSQTDKSLASEAEAEALRTGKQDALTTTQLANIAAVSDALAFDATRSYAAGDPVVYNGTLYTFTAAHTGAWTGNDVSAVDIIAMLAGKLDKSGDTMTGSLHMGDNYLKWRNGNLIYWLSTNGLYIWGDGDDVTHSPNYTIEFPQASGTLALTSAIPYTLVTKTISNGAVSLDDRAINAVAVSSSLASLTVNFPTATSGKARDFGLRLTVASGITTAPELALPQGVTCENADGAAPEIGADGAATILYFTETASGVFLVKGEVVTAIS